MTDIPEDTPRSTEIDRGLREADCVHLAGCARFERALPKLHPLEHLLSQNRPDAGWRGQHRRSRPVSMGDPASLTQPDRSPTVIRRLRRADRDLAANRTASLCGPPYDWLAPAARRVHPLFTGAPANRTRADPIPLARAGSNPCDRHGRGVELLSRLNHPGPRARFPRRPAKGNRDWRYPRCLPSIGYLRPSTGLSSRTLRQAGQNPQLFTSLWRIHGALFDTR